MGDKNSRKENGDGSIFQVNESKWIARIQYGSLNGKPQIKSFSAKTEALVKKKLREFKRDKTKYLPENVGYVIFEDYINKWIYEYKRNELKGTSFDRLESTIHTHIIPAVGSAQLQKINNIDLQSLINKLYEDKLSYSTIKKVYDALNSCLSYAVSKNDIEKNPMTSVSLPSKNKFESSEVKIFTEEELSKIICELNTVYANGAYKYRYRDAYMLILNTGIRMGECLGIKKSDINLSDKTIHIQRDVAIVKQRNNKDDISEITSYKVIMQNSVKTYSGDRYIDLNDTAVSAVKNLMALYPNGEMLTQNRNGEVVSPTHLIRSFKGILDTVGINSGGIHALRHTFASMLFKNGIDIKTVSELLGHSSTKITYDTYIHILQKRKQEAVQSLVNMEYHMSD